jgi:hypothetical protein
MGRTFIISERQYRLYIEPMVVKIFNETIEKQQAYTTENPWQNYEKTQQNNSYKVNSNDKRFSLQPPEPYVATQDKTKVIKTLKPPNRPTRTPEEAARIMSTRNTGVQVTLPKKYVGGLWGQPSYLNNCAATVTDSYGFYEASNVIFKQKHRTYGFEELPRENYEPKIGDIIQYHKNTINNIPTHMLMITGDNIVHHTYGQPGKDKIRSNPFYKNSTGNGLIIKGDTTMFTPFRLI